MAEKKTPTRKAPVTSTKKEMLEAYSEALPGVEEKRQAELKPEERITEKAAKRVAEIADTVSIDGIVKEIGALKADMGKLLASLADRLEEEVEKYEAVKQAIGVREKELQEIFEIQKSASTLEALLEAQATKRAEFEAEMAEKRDVLLREIEAARVRWTEEKARHEADLREQETVLSKTRQREKEEYEYTLNRERQLARDRFEGEKAKLQGDLESLEREIQLKREQLGRELSEREQAVRQAEAELEELRRRVAAFPKELETSVGREVKSAVERVRAELGAKEELLRKEFEGERNVLKTRIEGLETTVKEQADQIAKLSQRLERSYGQIQDIAVKAIEGPSAQRGFAAGLSSTPDSSRSQSLEKP